MIGPSKWSGSLLWNKAIRVVMCVCALAVRDRGTAAEPCLSLLSTGWTVCPRVCTGQASQHAAVAHKRVMHSRPLDRWHCVCMPSV